MSTCRGKVKSGGGKGGRLRIYGLGWEDHVVYYCRRDEANDCWLLLLQRDKRGGTSGTPLVQSQSQHVVACMGVNKWGFLAVRDDHAQELQQAKKLPASARRRLARGMCSPSLLATRYSPPTRPHAYHYHCELSQSGPHRSRALHAAVAGLVGWYAVCSSSCPCIASVRLSTCATRQDTVGLDVGRFPATPASPTASLHALLLQDARCALGNPAAAECLAGLTLKDGPGPGSADCWLLTGIVEEYASPGEAVNFSIAAAPTRASYSSAAGDLRAHSQLRHLLVGTHYSIFRVEDGSFGSIIPKQVRELVCGPQWH